MGALDASDVRRAAGDLRRIPIKASPVLRAVVSKGALNVKNQLKSEAKGSPAFGVIAPAITYELNGGAGRGFIEALIGPEKGHPGSLANVAYFGTSRGGGTVPDPGGALDAEAPRLTTAIQAALGRLL